MKDILVLLCCSGLMVNNRFIFITVQYVDACVCMCICVCAVCVSAHVCVCPSLPSPAVIMDIWNSVPASRLSRGITHLPQILCSLVVLGFAADLMRVESFVVVNFSIHPKEEEKVPHRGEKGKEKKKNKVATLSCFSQWKGMTTNTWGHFLISSLSTQTGHIIHQELYSMGKSHPPMGISPFLKTVVLYLLLWFGNLYHTVFMEEWFLTLPNTETFFHFLISKRGWDVLGLDETGWCEEAGSALWGKDEIMGWGEKIRLRFKRCADRRWCY